jgi:hypothetical protein
LLDRPVAGTGRRGAVAARSARATRGNLRRTRPVDGARVRTDYLGRVRPERRRSAPARLEHRQVGQLRVQEAERPEPGLAAKAGTLADGLKDAAGVAGIPIVVNRVGSIMSCFFTDRPVCNFEDVQSTNIRQFKKFFASMLSNEIYIAPSAYEAMFVSLAHSKKDIEKTIEAAKAAFKAVD